jgi:hypothetical protein
VHDSDRNRNASSQSIARGRRNLILAVGSSPFSCSGSKIRRTSIHSSEEQCEPRQPINSDARSQQTAHTQATSQTPLDHPSQPIHSIGEPAHDGGPQRAAAEGPAGGHAGLLPPDAGSGRRVRGLLLLLLQRLQAQQPSPPQRQGEVPLVVLQRQQVQLQLQESRSPRAVLQRRR